MTSMLSWWLCSHMDMKQCGSTRESEFHVLAVTVPGQLITLVAMLCH